MIRVLDMFCGAGGAAMGILQAAKDRGVEIELVGVDIAFHTEYPSLMVTDDIRRWGRSFELGNFDFVWASPPCQAFSVATQDRSKHEDLIEHTRKILLAIPAYCIENVPNAPLRKDLVLCGEMFDLGVIRHRIFEVKGFSCPQPEHKQHKGLCSMTNTLNGREYYYETVAGHGSGKNIVSRWSKAMGIDHMKKKRSLAQAVPPAYSKYIFGQWLDQADIKQIDQRRSEWYGKLGFAYPAPNKQD